MKGVKTPLRGLFVTGTDTGVGKTAVSAALLHVLAQRRRVAGLKPVAAGLEADGSNEDVQRLLAQSQAGITAAEVGPLQLPTPCAPHIAADLAHRRIDRAALVAAAHDLSRQVDALVIEGVGGFVVPLSGPNDAEAFDTADLAGDYALPVVLVVGLRLGCLNHALLTAEAIHARGLRLVGWVANTLDAPMPYACENIDTLRHRLWARWQAPCWGVLPWLPGASSPALAGFLDAPAVHAAVQSART